jgi:hypothetical protein
MPSVLAIVADTFDATDTSHRLMKTDAIRGDVGASPASMAPLDAAQMRLRGCDVLSREKQQRHVDRHTGKRRFLYAGRPSSVPGILMNRLRRAARACSCFATAVDVFVS